MRPLDWLVFLAFLAYVVWDGVRRGSASRDLEGYYAGGRSIPWWAAGLSVMATQASASNVSPTLARILSTPSSTGTSKTKQKPSTLMS